MLTILQVVIQGKVFVGSRIVLVPRFSVPLHIILGAILIGLLVLITLNIQALPQGYLQVTLGPLGILLARSSCLLLVAVVFLGGTILCACMCQGKVVLIGLGLCGSDSKCLPNISGLCSLLLSSHAI